MYNVILIAKETLTRSLIGAQLMEEGFEVTGAASIAEAAAQVNTQGISPHLVIVDASEQDLSPKTVRLLSGLCPQTPLLLIHGTSDSPSQLNWQGKICRLARPLTVGHVVDAVQRLLQGFSPL